MEFAYKKLSVGDFGFGVMVGTTLWLNNPV